MCVYIYIFQAILTTTYTAWHFHSASPLGLKTLPKHDDRNSILVKALTRAPTRPRASLVLKRDKNPCAQPPLNKFYHDWKSHEMGKRNNFPHPLNGKTEVQKCNNLFNVTKSFGLPARIGNSLEPTFCDSMDYLLNQRWLVLLIL